MLRLTLGVPYRNLYKVASNYGKAVIDGMELYLTQSSVWSVNEPYMKGKPDPVHAAWGTKSFGSCYNKWDTDLAKGKFLHYKYEGPDVNPYGVHSKCNQPTKC